MVQVFFFQILPLFIEFYILDAFVELGTHLQRLRVADWALRGRHPYS